MSVGGIGRRARRFVAAGFRRLVAFVAGLVDAVTSMRSPRVQRLAVALTKLGAVGASAGLLVGTPIMGRMSTFLMSNTLPPPTRRLQLLAAIGIGILAPVAAAWIYVLARKDRALARVERLATLLAPLALAFALPPLFNWRLAQESKLLYLVMLSLFGLGGYWLLVPSFAAAGQTFPLSRLPWRRMAPPRWACLLVVVLAVAGYAAYMSHFSIQNHRQLKTTAFDLGIYDNLLYNALHGKLFRSPVLFGPVERSYLAGHAEFAMLLFLPFYAIKPGVETMLIMQAIVIGAAAIPLYFFVKTLLPPVTAAVVAMAYLLFAPLHGPQFYDFHWLPLAMFFHFLLYYAIARNRHWLLVVSVMVLYAFREDVAVGLTMLGLFLFVTGLRPRIGLVLAPVSAAWFVFVKFYIMHKAGAWWFENMYAALFADGKASYGSVMQTMVSNPIYVLSTLLKEEKVVYLLHMLAPLALFPVRRPVLVMLMLPGAVFTLLTTGYSPTVSIAFQYTTHWMPYLFLALVLALVAVSREVAGARKLAAATVVVALAVTCHSYAFGAVFQHNSFVGGFQRIDFKWKPEQAERYRQLRKIVDMIPADASVTATEFMNPHICTRMDSYVLRWDPGPVDYILFSTYELSSDVRRYLADRFAKTPYGLVATAHNEFYLLKKGHVAPETRVAMMALGLSMP